MCVCGMCYCNCGVPKCNSRAITAIRIAANASVDGSTEQCLPGADQGAGCRLPDDDEMTIKERETRHKKFQQGKEEEDQVYKKFVDADMDDLMEEIITLKEQLAEERAERVNSEETLQKVGKKAFHVAVNSVVNRSSQFNKITSK